jgi:hypothetical protein
VIVRDLNRNHLNTSQKHYSLSHVPVSYSGVEAGGVDYCWANSVGIATRLWAGQPRNLSSIPGRGRDVSSSPMLPDRLRGPPGLLANM